MLNRQTRKPRRQGMERTLLVAFALGATSILER